MGSNSHNVRAEKKSLQRVPAFTHTTIKQNKIIMDTVKINTVLIKSSMIIPIIRTKCYVALLRHLIKLLPHSKTTQIEGMSHDPQGLPRQSFRVLYKGE